MTELNRELATKGKRLSVNISDELDQLLTDLANEAHISRTDVVRRALAIMKAYRDQQKVGRKHMGFTSDSSKLDAEILNVL